MERIAKQGFTEQEAESIASTLDELKAEPVATPSTIGQAQPVELYQEDEGQLFDDQQKPKPLRKPRKTITAEVGRYLDRVLKSDPAAMDYQQILHHEQDLRALQRVFPNQKKRIQSAIKQAESFKPAKREIAKEISTTQRDIVQHDIYQQTLDDLLASLEPIHPTAVEPTFAGEVKSFLEGRPYLKGQITIYGETGRGASTWDEQMQQWSERTGKSFGSINEWLELVDLKDRLQKGRAVNPEALARAVQTGEPNIGWLADKLSMLKSGKSLKEIKAAEREALGGVKPRPAPAKVADDEFADFFDFEAKPKRKAATRFLEDGRAVIKAFEGADISSVVHELAHIFRRGVKGEDLKALEKWAGVVDGQWTRDAEEKFARGFERYLYEGVAPSNAMQKVFDLFRKWLLDIYRSLEKSSINVEISDEVRKVFDRILTLERSEIHPGEMNFVEFQKMLAQSMASPSGSAWIRRYGIDLEQSPFLEWRRMQSLAKQIQQDIIEREGKDDVIVTAEQQAEISAIESEEPAEPFILDAKKLIIADLLDKASKDGLNKVKAKKALRLAYAAGETVGTKTAEAKGKEKLAAKLAEAKEHFRQVVMEAKARKAIRETILKLGRRISKKVPAQVAIEYKEMIAAIQDGFDPSFRSKRTIGNRQRLRDIAARNPGMVQADTLKRFGKKSIGEYFFDELESMADLVESLKAMGKEKYAAWRAQWDADRQAEIDAIKESLDQYKPSDAKPASPSMEKRPGYIVRAVKGLRAASLRPSVLADLIDGGKALYNGMAFRLIRTLSNEARNAELAGQERRQAAFDAFMKSKGLTIHDLRHKVWLGAEDFTVDDVVGIYTRRLNPKSKLAMIYGNGITQDQLAQAVYYCEMTDPRMADLSKFILDEYEANYLSLDDAYVKDTGLAGNPRRMVKENNYTSIVRLEVYDQRSGDFKNQSEGEVLAEQNQLLRGIGRYYTEKGMTHARKNVPAEFQSRILLGLVEGWMRDVSRQEHYKAHVELQKIYHKVFWNRDIADLIQHRLGNEYQAEIKDLLNRTIDPDSIRKYDWGSVFFRSTKKNTGIAFLALNFMSLLKAPVSVITYAPFCGGPTRLIASGLKFAANPIGQWNKVRGMSPQTKSANIDQLLDDLRRDLSYVRAGRLGGIAKAKAQTQAAFMSLYSLVDGISRTIGWDATYQYNLSQDKSDQEARDAADEATQRTQGASAARDLPGLYAKNEAVTAALTFTNELNQVWNLMTYDTPRHWVNKQYVRAAMTLFGVLLSESIIWALTYRRLPEDKKDLASLAGNALVSPIPLVGSVLQGREIYPLAGSLATALASTSKAIVNGDFDKVNVDAMLETAALAYGIPYIGPKRVIQAVAEEEPLYLVGGPKRRKAM